MVLSEVEEDALAREQAAHEVEIRLLVLVTYVRGGTLPDSSKRGRPATR